MRSAMRRNQHPRERRWFALAGLATLDRGCSSVVEHHVANVDVEGSNPFTRFFSLVGPPERFSNRALAETK
jgi:hypothetical protein